MTVLVPTMGALHKGHQALIKRARELDKEVVVSIFVNPLQFTDAADLEKYPRTPETDIQIATLAGATEVWFPNYEEIYQKSGVANGFNPAIARYLCEKFGAKSVFDPCMGWGDRLIGCMAAGVKKYVGYDTNTKLEEKYIDFFMKRYNIVLESNDVITDYHIMKNAKILCCSCSTLSWAAAFFSETVELVYFPNYEYTDGNDGRYHERFKKPIENTVLYDFDKCSQETLETILS